VLDALVVTEVDADVVSLSVTDSDTLGKTELDTE
jgi:hypothetical protein